MQLLVPCMQHHSKGVCKQYHAAAAHDHARILQQVSEPTMQHCVAVHVWQCSHCLMQRKRTSTLWRPTRANQAEKLAIACLHPLCPSTLIQQGDSFPCMKPLMPDCESSSVISTT